MSGMVAESKVLINITVYNECYYAQLTKPTYTNINYQMANVTLF